MTDGPNRRFERSPARVGPVPSSSAMLRDLSGWLHSLEGGPEYFNPGRRDRETLRRGGVALTGPRGFGLGDSDLRELALDHRRAPLTRRDGP